MPKLRVVSGKKLISLLEQSSFVVNRIKGSHAILDAPGKPDVVVVPLHKEIDRGTLHSIIKSISPYVSEEFISKNFYR